MKTNICRNLCAAALLGASMAAYGQADAPDARTNPFLTEYTTPYGVPPFEQIEVADYREAFLKGMEEQRQEIDAIVRQRSVPTFENTIVALDRSGALLRRVSLVFGGQNSCNTTPELQALSKELSPLFSAHSDDISLNAALFARVKQVYDNRDRLGLNKEQMKLLEETYKDFVRSGANLSQQKLRELNSRIALLQLTFGQNMLQETNAYKLVIDNEADLSGLPATLVASAAETARQQGLEGKWVFTLQNPSVMPFLQYADNRALREQIFKAYTNRGNNGNDADNKAVVRELLEARLEKARLHGQDTRQGVCPARPDLGTCAGESQGRAEGHPGRNQEGRQKVQGRRLGLALLLRESQEGQVRHRRERSAPLSGEPSLTSTRTKCAPIWS